MAADQIIVSVAPLLSEQAIKLMPGEESSIVDPHSHVCEWMSTSLRLPHVNNNATEEQDSYLCLPVHVSEASYFKLQEEKEEYKDDSYCIRTSTDLRLIQLHQYLAAVNGLILPTQILLSSDTEYSDNLQNKYARRSKYDRQVQTRPPPHRLITSTNSGRVINVLQGEIAHCTPSQADTLVSDDATTCHIVALWSRYSSSGSTSNNVGGEMSSIDNNILASMTHIDGPGYERCIRDAVNEHIQYHSMHSKQYHNVINFTEECKESSSGESSDGIIGIDIHIMGGFNDNEGSSIEITDNILQTLAAVSNECNYSTMVGGALQVRMTLETCAATSANDDGQNCPLGRGLAMDVTTGNVFLAEVEDIQHDEPPRSPAVSLSNGIGMVAQLLNVSTHNNAQASLSTQGPEAILRSVRLWASAFHPRSRRQRRGRLHVIHRPNQDHICIDPFFFGPHANAKSLLDCNNEELLRITSTSPEVEKFNFAAKVRESLIYMNKNKSSNVFPEDKPLKYRRVGMNGWVRYA